MDDDRWSLGGQPSDPDPFRQFAAWYREGLDAQPFWGEAVVLATATADGRPSARAVLLRGHDQRGLVFYTDRRSRKAEELSGNPRAALVFLWAALERQVRAEGDVTITSEEESDAYFEGRPRGSQLGAWASHQSAAIEGRHELERQVAALDAQYRDRPLPRPPFWGGYRLVPSLFEFWQGRPDRLHDRVQYHRAREAWRRVRLSP